MVAGARGSGLGRARWMDGGATRQSGSLIIVDETMTFELAQERLHFLNLFRREARDINDIMLPIG